ncbi:lung seven transmembrane receptor-domain-containing protein [Blastocladiella britannica]|nr:lung seven transmembrane receptor-domain-containing protein [Blastocladiella britannica]
MRSGRVAKSLALALVILLVSVLTWSASARPQGDLDLPPLGSDDGGMDVDPYDGVDDGLDFLEDLIDEELLSNRICFAMNAKDRIPGGQDAYVEVKYVPPSQGASALAIYNLLDQPLMGRALTSNQIEYLCSDIAASSGDCGPTGQIVFSTSSKTVKQLHAPVLSIVTNFAQVSLPYAVRYNVTKTGLYCLIGMPLGGLFDETISDAELKYVNAHGLLPAIDYPKMPFVGFTCLIYLTVFLLWMGKSAMHWNEILPIQKYISGVIAFLVFETAINYFYLLDWNNRGEQSWALLVLSALLNSARNSVSLFILLIVSLGYGVLKPSLGDDMKRCQILAAVHLVFGALYTGFTLKQSDHKSPFILLVALPLAITLTAFYIWTLTALTATTQHLQLRRQHFKLHMYTILWRVLLFAGINLALYFITNAVWFARRDDVVFVARWWPYRWFVVDGWLNALYSVAMLAVCWQWRPTENNARYGLEEILADPLEDEFELGDGEYDAVVAPWETGAAQRDRRAGAAAGASGGGAAAAAAAGSTGKPESSGEVVFALDSDSEDDDDHDDGQGHTYGPGNSLGEAMLRSRSPSPQRGRTGRPSSESL